MKRAELIENAECGNCHKKVGATGAVFFYRVRVQQYVVRIDAVMRHMGLEMMLNPAIAAAMGTDEEMATMVSEEEISVCSDCLTCAPIPLCYS